MSEHKFIPTIRYSFVQGIFWTSYAALVSYSSVFLLAKGFTNSQIGLLIAIAGTLSAILQPVVAGFTESRENLSLKSVILVIGSIMVCLALTLSFIKDGRVLITLIFGGLIVVLQILTPLINALGMEPLNKGVTMNFGVARGMGSLAYAGVSYLLGSLVGIYGVRVIPYAVVVIFVLLMIAVRSFHYKIPEGVNIQRAQEQQTEERASGGLSFFKTYPRFFVFLLGCILVYTSHNLLNSFVFQIMETKGGGSSEMGVVLAIAAIFELPTMFFFFYMLKLFRCRVWLKVSGVFFTIKAIGTLLAVNVMSMYLLQVVQMFGFALFTVVSVYYVNELMQNRDRIKGQAFLTMTNTVGSVVGALAGGVVLDTGGVPVLLVASIVSAGAGAFIFMVSAEDVA